MTVALDLIVDALVNLRGRVISNPAACRGNDLSLLNEVSAEEIAIVPVEESSCASLLPSRRSI